MTPQEIIEKEPRLNDVIEWLKAENQKAKFKTIYYWEVWIRLKQMIRPLVGWDSENIELREARAWDIMANYFETLTPNMK